MLEGLEVSIETFIDTVGKVEYHGRFEAEFFSKSAKKLLSTVRKLPHDNLGNLVFLTDGEHGNAITSPEGFAKYYGARNVLDGILNNYNVEFITEKHHNRISKSKLYPNDILISCVGANIGYASIVHDNVGEANIVRNVAVLRSTDDRVNNHFLLAYFLSKYGKTFFIRMSTGNAQPLVSLDYIKTIPVVILGHRFQNELEKVIELAKSTLVNSFLVYGEAEYILLSELGLSNWKPTIKNNNIKTLKESFAVSGRIDAEYYQPKFDELEGAIKNLPHKTIKEIRKDNYRGLQPEYVQDGTLDVINSKHILETTLDYKNFEKTSQDYWDFQDRARVYQYDILTYTTGANIGRTQTYLLDKPALASNHVNIIRLKEQDPSYVGFVLNSLVGRLQTEKRSAGSAQLELYPKDLDEFLIPILPSVVQSQIADKILKSFAFQNQSKELLEAAKTAVEIAIEQGEQTAINYLQKIANA